jgi:hypothetical protein
VGTKRILLLINDMRVCYCFYGSYQCISSDASSRNNIISDDGPVDKENSGEAAVKQAECVDEMNANKNVIIIKII